MKPLGPSDPTSVASYRLLGVLGGGGMGRVYLGQSPAGRRLAIKVVRVDLAEEPTFRRRFAHEIAAVQTVNPLFTATIVDADPDADPPWLATTYIDGPNLRDWVTDHGPLAPGAVLLLAAGLAEALASFHRTGLVHRDLKPSNVLLDETGPRIIDFGIAVASGATRLTVSLVGTPSYLAPELIGGGEPSPASDVFSLGATLVFAATGVPLVRDGTIFQQFVQISTGRFDLSLLPRELRPIIVRCLSRRPRDRPTAEELARILVGTGISIPGPDWYGSAPALPAKVGSLGGHRLSRRQALRVGAAVGIAVAGGGLAVATFERAGPADARTRGGTILWQLGSGAPADSPPRLPGDEHLIVHRDTLLIFAAGSRVTAVDRRGDPRWSRDLAGGSVGLRRWGDAVLANSASHAWLLDPDTGRPLFLADPVVTERAAAPGGAVELRRIALSGTRAFLDLTSATVAIDRAGRVLWREPRLAQPDGLPKPPGTPLAADAAWLVAQDTVPQDAAGQTAQVSLVDPATGTVRWSIRHPITHDDRAGPRDGSHPEEPPPDGGSGGGPRRPPPEPAWQMSEARIGNGLVALRDVEDFQVVRVSDGSTVWHRKSEKPVVTVELTDDLLLVAADQLYAYNVGTGEPLWQAQARGARLALAPDRPLIVATGDDGVMALDRSGHKRWQTRWPASLASARPDRVSIEDGVVYVTFHPAPDQHDTLDVAVVAIALD